MTGSFLAAFSAMVLLSFAGQAQAAMWSLADDFSLATNTNSSTWSYGLEGDVDAPVDMQLFTVNTRTAVELWGTAFPTSPTLWSDASGYWGLGRNDTGVTQTAGAVSWAPGEILLHPKFTVAPGDFPGRLVISWLAPITTTVNIDYSFSSATSSGNGAGIQIVHESTTLSGFHNPYPLGESDTLSNISVTAGDRLYFDFDTWGDAAGDITRMAITIETVPEPGSLTLLGMGLAGLGLLVWRKRQA